MNGFQIVMEIGDEPDSDPVSLTHDLRDELRSADLDARIVEGGEPPGGTKSMGSIVRWLELYGLTLDGVGAALAASAAWVTRTRRTVRIKINDDILILDGVTVEQQDRIIEAFVSRHAIQR